MDAANGNFRACFIGAGDNAANPCRDAKNMFYRLSNAYKAYCDEQADLFEGSERPVLTVLDPSMNDSVSQLPHQDVVFMIGKDNDQSLLKRREEIIALNKSDFLFTLVKHSKDSVEGDVHARERESLIFLNDGSEQQALTFINDICRFGIFPHLLSCDFMSATEMLLNRKAKILIFESDAVGIEEPFQHFIELHGISLKRCSGVLAIVSSNLGDTFSIRKHYDPIMSAINTATGSTCTNVFSDSLYAEEFSSIRVTMVCAESDHTG